MKTKVQKCLKGKLPKGVKTASGEDLMKEIKGLKSKIVSSPQNTAFGNITRCDDQNELKMKLKKPKRVRKPNIYTDELEMAIRTNGGLPYAALFLNHSCGMVYPTPKQIRKMADWLIKAADYLEHKARKK